MNPSYPSSAHMQTRSQAQHARQQQLARRASGRHSNRTPHSTNVYYISTETSGRKRRRTGSCSRDILQVPNSDANDNSSRRSQYRYNRSSEPLRQGSSPHLSGTTPTEDGFSVSQRSPSHSPPTTPINSNSCSPIADVYGSTTSAALPARVPASAPAPAPVPAVTVIASSNASFNLLDVLADAPAITKLREDAEQEFSRRIQYLGLLFDVGVLTSPDSNPSPELEVESGFKLQGYSFKSLWRSTVLFTMANNRYTSPALSTTSLLELEPRKDFESTVRSLLLRYID